MTLLPFKTRQARRPLHVLFADPSGRMTDRLKRDHALLDALGITLRRAQDMDRLPHIAGAEHFDVMFCPFMTEEKTTLSLLAPLRQVHPSIAVVLVVEEADATREWVARATGATGLIARADVSAFALVRLSASLFTREEGRFPADVARFDAGATVAAAIAPLARQAKGRGVLFFTPPALPIMMEADAGRFNDLLEGVLGEAASLLASGEKLTVSLHLRAGMFSLRLEGEGMASACRKRSPGLREAEREAAEHARRALLPVLAEAMGGSVVLHDAPRFSARLDLPLRQALS